MDTQTQIDRLIELAIIQRSELKQLVEQLPQLREHLNAEVEKVFEETEPQLRAELEEWTTKQTADKTAALGVALEAKIADLAKSLEVSTQARYNAIIAEREENARLAAQAEAKIAEHAASLPSAVKDIVTAELARFPRAGEIDQLRKEFAEPRGLNPRGKWQAGETYNRLDLVTVNGDSFVSNIDGNKERPSRSATNWTLNAARGMGGGSGFTSLNNVLGDPSAGQIVGSEGGQYVRKTLVAGANITINETANAITIIGDEGQISLQDGTAAAPSLFFTNDTDTGIYRPAANTLGISTSGVQRMYVDENGITTVGAGGTFDGSVHAANGNANNPSFSFSSDQDTGFFRHAANEIGIALGGTQYATLTSTTFSITPVVTMASSLRVNGTTDSSSKDTGAIVTEGGLGVEKSASIGGALTVNGAIISTLGNNTTIFNSASATTGYQVFNLQNTSGRLQFGLEASTGGNLITGSTAYATCLTTIGNKPVQIGVDQALIGSFSSTGLAITGALSSTGNLTVSGTGTSTFAGKVQSIVPSATGYNQLYDTSGITTGRGAFAITSTGAGLAFGIEASAGGTSFAGSAAYSSYIGTTTATPFYLIYNSTIGATLTSTGNLLLGTTTDSSNGKLQLATHTTSAGGIGFGTDVSLFRAGTKLLNIAAATANYLAIQPDASTYNFQISTSGSDAGLRLTRQTVADWDITAGSSFIIKKDGTTALTLDSSQNATFAGAVQITTNASSVSRKLVIFDSSAANNTQGIEFSNTTLGSSGSSAYIRAIRTSSSGSNTDLTFGTMLSGVVSEVLKLDSSQNATFAGNIKTAAPSGGTAATWRLGTVASVSPTSPNRTIEVEIGGTTYYIHAKTTNN